jgi:hypothetical protein
VKAASVFGDRQGPVRAGLVRCDLLMRSLGRPNREQVVSTRPDELTTLVALDLTNGPALADLIEPFGQKMVEEHADWSADQITDWLYVRLLCRRPTAAERQTARKLVGTPATDTGVADLTWCLLMLPEFQLVR